DRAVRALKFAEIAALDLQLDYYVTFGAYEAQVADHMVKLGYPREQIIHLGDSVKLTEADILPRIASLIPGQQGVLIGLVNIHTAQAEYLMDFFQNLHTNTTIDNQLLSDVPHLSTIAQRQRYLVSRFASRA
ncbi:MAG: hypothetical protein AAF629_29790, partial [Chloroflexota bacterium]